MVAMVLLGLAIIPDEGYDFLGEIGIENGLNVAAMEGMRSLIIEAETVDGIDGVELNASSIDELRESADHTLSFQFPFVPGTGRKAEYRGTPVAVNNHSEIEAKTGRIPAVIFTFHLTDLSSCGTSCGRLSMPVGRRKEQMV